MEAKELRIGNKIFFIICDKENSNLDEKKEITVDISDFEFIRDNNSLFEGIPLTEEWLLKFGFSEIGGCNEKDFTNGDYNIFINSIGEVNFLFFREGDWYQKLSYVHQLQNLFFALTGEELKLIH